MTTKCELCKDEATIYCPSDNAFLCPRCDTLVHAANFLAARHLRHPLRPAAAVSAPSARHDDDNDDSTSSSSSTSPAVSSTSCASSVASRRPKGMPGVKARVLAAAAAVAEAGIRGGPTAGRQCLRRVEARSGVPARVIAAVARRLGRGAAAAEEGWAEC